MIGNKMKKRLLSVALCCMVSAWLLPVQSFGTISSEEMAQLKGKTSAEIKVMMDAAKAEEQRYAAQKKKDEKAFDDAQNAWREADAKIQPAKENIEPAERVLDQKSRQFADQMVTETWNKYDSKCFNTRNSVAVNTVAKYRDKGMTYDNAYQFYLSDGTMKYVKGVSYYNNIIQTFESKFGKGTFEEVYTKALGYNSLMLGMEHIDRCNAIRSDRTELAKFWTGVRGESVPDDIKTLGVSPSMVVSTAMNAALASSADIKEPWHIFTRGGLGMQGTAQIEQNYDKKGGGRITNAYGALWSHENGAKMQAHNAIIASRNSGATGAVVLNWNIYMDRAVFSQDISGIDPAYWTCTTDYYRSRLQGFCRSELNVYNARVNAYDAAVKAKEDAALVMADARTALNKTASSMKAAQTRYSDLNKIYEQKLREEKAAQPRYFTVCFVDGLTRADILEVSALKGSSVTPPTPPVHKGYVFIGWDRDTYRNVQDITYVFAEYRECDESGADAKAGGRETANHAAAAIPAAVSVQTPAPLQAVSAMILNAKNDSDQKGSTYHLLRAKGTAKSKTSVRLKWKVVSGADSYIIYGSKCGKGNHYRKLARTGSTAFVQKKLKKGRYYKYIVTAVKGGSVIAVSKTVHVATKGGKAGNYKKLKLKNTKTNVTLKTGKSLRLKVKAVPQSKKLRVKIHRAVKYESTNLRVAKVRGNGTVTATGSGKCYIDAYAQNGVCKRICVTVK